MFIKKLSVKNFKSIDEVTIEFTPLTMLVGANASGKSNVINVFRFISDILTEGIDNAIALQGGVPYLSNVNLPKSTPIEVSFVLDFPSENWIRKSYSRNIALAVEELHYKFAIQPTSKGNGYHILYDYLEIQFASLNGIRVGKKSSDYQFDGRRVSFHFDRKTSKSKVHFNCVFSSDEELSFVEELSFDEQAIEKDIPSRVFCSIIDEDKTELMLTRVGLLLPPQFPENAFIRIFDFDPKLLKKPSSIASLRLLHEDGSNIASVLQGILKRKEDRKKLTMILKDFLPFVEDITIENTLDKSYTYKVREKYCQTCFNSSFLSDGTVSILATIVALYFEPKSQVVILEEPERNIHPKLLSTLLQAAEDVASTKQVIITTHNPIFLRNAKIKNVKLVSRNTDGYSKVTSPNDSKSVQAFIQSELGLDDLFLQDLLGD